MLGVQARVQCLQASLPKACILWKAPTVYSQACGSALGRMQHAGETQRAPLQCRLHACAAVPHAKCGRAELRYELQGCVSHLERCDEGGRGRAGGGPRCGAAAGRSPAAEVLRSLEKLGDLTVDLRVGAMQPWPCALLKRPVE